MDLPLGHETPILGEATPTETPVAVPEVKQQDESSSAKFAALARKEKALVAKMREQRQVQEQFAREKAEMMAWRKEMEDSKKDPLKALNKLGWDYDKLTEYQMSGGKVTPEMEIESVKSEIQQMREHQIQAEKQRTEQEQMKAQAQTQEIINTFKENLTEKITSMPDKYENIIDEEAFELVFETIEEHFNRTGKVLSETDAADLVESYLDDRAESKFKLKKFQGKYAPTKVEEKKEPSKTLSSQTSTSSGASFLPAKTENDRIQRALAKLNGV